MVVAWTKSLLHKVHSIKVFLHHNSVSNIAKTRLLGCQITKTCNETKFGCCEDGVSPATGKKFEGCPSTHCEETLFGCCPDNKTAATGNDNEGCPPPPPECAKSK